jgi:hypothetical protein
LFVDGDVATDIENTVGTENNDWLHSNQSYQPIYIYIHTHTHLIIMNKIAYVGECSVMSVDNSSIIDLNKTPCTKGSVWTPI